MLTYKIEYLASVVSEDLPALPKSARELIKRAIEQRLTIDPIGLGKPLRYDLKGLRRLRVGSYRILYRIEGINCVVITRIDYRRDVYE